MSDLRSQLRQYVDSNIERLDADDLVAGLDSPSLRMPSPRRRSPVLVAVASAVAVLLLVGGTVLVFAPSAEVPPVATNPTVAPQPEPSSAVTTETTVAPQPEPTTASLPGPVTTQVPVADITSGWSRVPHDVDVFGGGYGGELRAVTQSGSGLVAVGDTCSDILDGNPVCEAGAWVSPDGVSWQRVPGGSDLFGPTALIDVAAGPSGVVAVGVTCRTSLTSSDPCDPAAWFSPDGLTWERASSEAFATCSTTPSNPDACSLETVVAGGPGFVACRMGHER